VAISAALSLEVARPSRRRYLFSQEAHNEYVYSHKMQTK